MGGGRWGWPGRRHAGAAGAERRLGPADAFFVYAESRQVPQTVVAAGVLAGSLTRDGLAAHLEARLADQLWLRRRLVTRWRGLRRPAWQPVPAADVDLDRHVLERPLPAPGGLAGLAAAAAAAAGRRLPRDRPAWQMVVLPGLAPDRTGFLVAVHHAVCDGPALVELLGPLFEPPTRAAAGRAPTRRSRRAAALRAVRGVAQLATDGMVRSGPFTGRLSAERRLAVASVPLATIRAAARGTGGQPTDVVLAAFGAAVAAELPERAARRRTLRAAVPVLARTGSAAAEAGNRTAALWVPVPLAEPDPVRQLQRVAAERARSAGSARPAGTRFVMERLAGMLPAPLHALAVRASYRGRFFHTIVSVMPGPRRRTSLAGAEVFAAFPVLPMAPRVGVTLGGLVWRDALCLGLCAEPGLLPDPDRLLAAVVAGIERLAATTDPAAAPVGPLDDHPGLPHAQAHG
jgi:hypothetical protein